MIYLQDKAAIAWKFNRTRYVKKLDGHKNVVEIIQIKPYCKLLRSVSMDTFYLSHCTFREM